MTLFSYCDRKKFLCSFRCSLFVFWEHIRPIPSSKEMVFGKVSQIVRYLSGSLSYKG